MLIQGPLQYSEICSADVLVGFNCGEEIIIMLLTSEGKEMCGQDDSDQYSSL